MTIVERIDNILDSRGMSRRQLAIAADIPASSLQSAMARGKNMTTEMLQAIANVLDVSADFLLGLSEDPAPTHCAVDELGLSPKAVHYLRTLHELSKVPPYDIRLSLLSYLLENRQFDLMLALCTKYVALMGMTPDSEFEGSADYVSCADTLKAHGFVVSLPDDQANALFSERITNLLRTILDARAEHTGG